ncbi:hypothetical protein [Coleofasciculus sp. E2-BRE-01]
MQRLAPTGLKNYRIPAFRLLGRDRTPTLICIPEATDYVISSA